MSDAETTHKTANVPEWKRREVDELVDFVESYDAVGVVDLTGIPSRQLQDMRRELHGQAALRMSRNTLTVRALEEVGGEVAELAGHMTGHVGLIGTNDNPFGLYQQLEASKTSAPIGAGEIAPNEIVIPEGDTGVDPGPFVGELQQIGADARIQEGSIQVLSDSVVAEAGDEVSADMANVLGELGIEPKEVGLDLRAVVADGVSFDPEDLAIDVDEYRADVEAAAAAGRNLSINAAYPTAQTAGALLGKAANEAKGLGVFAAIEDEAIMPDLVAKADAQVRAIAAEIDDEDALPEALRDLDAPAAADAADDAGDDDEADADEADADEAQDDEDDTEDDGDDDGAAGLGNMFGD
ncbi:50S ribosomal protein L10 [Halobaculum sp. MBLA0147]|uniref:50S ribosomal protein L10 n=1 Tax=Halobaculum sp. MBLA0147 TaxID=3079934 RepID=UPI003524F958